MRRDLPSGTVTFVFTDVEGSTKLLHEHGAAYADLLAQHRRILRAAFARHGGVEVDTQGDAFFVAFARASDALAAAADARAALEPTPVRVRIGIHTGAPVVTDEGYVGVDVHKGARIAAAAHGGQVVLSQETRALVDGEVTELGEHRLKDFAEPFALYQLGSERFPPLKTLSNTNLPRPASSFVGRERELAEVAAQLQDGARLLTLTGPGGSGKTRLALEAAAELVPEFKAGVFWVALATVHDPALVTETIAGTLGAKDGLAEHIGDRELLLLLDNLEQVVEVAPELASLVEACPNLRLLVTSRELLRVRGEVEYPVLPLATAEAVELFCARAGVEPDETVAQLCRALDNLPLALELAAARTSVLSPAQILARLSRRLDLLTGGRDADPRQQTLRATIEWSHELLTSDEQALFRRLAVFVGGWSLEAAETICAADLDTLQSLVDKSLVRHSGERFWMLETIREFAVERLEHSGEAEELRSQHAQYFLGFMPWISHLTESSDRPRWGELREQFADDFDNLRAALDWFRASGDVRGELWLANSMYWLYLFASGRLGELRRVLEAALARAHEVDPALRADALATLANLVRQHGDWETALRYAQESVALARTVEDKRMIERPLRSLARLQDDPRERRRLLLECEELARELGDEFQLGWVHQALGHNALEVGDYDEARRRLEAFVAISERMYDDSWTYGGLCDLGLVAVLDGRYGDACRLLGEALRDGLERQRAENVGYSLEGFAAIALAEGEAETATRLLGAAAQLREDAGYALMEYHRPLLSRTEAAALDRLGNRFAREWEAGKAMTLDEAAALALREPR